MTAPVAATRAWAQAGTALLVAGAAQCELDGPSGLPGWTRRHLLSHVAANADALGNLVRWAATGEPTPMYASPQARAQGIEDGLRLPDADLLARVSATAAALERGMDGLDDQAWSAPVQTAQGRTVAASEIPWLRARETCVHAVDLGVGVRFEDLPADFLVALCDDVVAKRKGGDGPALELASAEGPTSWAIGDADPVTIVAPTPELAAYLTGRPHTVTTTTGEPAPELGAWL